MNYALAAFLALCAVLPVHAETAVALQCMAWAADHYQVDYDLVRAIALQEGGTTGRVNWNRNLSYDIGKMQINSSHLGELAQYGISEAALQEDECLNITIGTWILKREIVQAPNIWVGVGNYHSHTPALNLDYQWRIYRRYQQIRQQSGYATAW